MAVVMAQRPVAWPPGPRTRSPFANMSAFRRGFLEFIEGLRRDHGDFVHFKLATRHMVLVNDPAAIRDILVTNNKNFTKSRGLRILGKKLLGAGLLTNEGASHRRQRKLISPAFHPQRIDAYGEDMVAATLKGMDRWTDGGVIDMDDEMMRAALAIAAKTMFGADVDDEADEISDAMTESMKVFEMLGDPFFVLTEKLPLPRNIRMKQARARIDATIYRMINQRRQDGVRRGDFLDILLNAQDDDGSGGMTDQQVRDEAITLFLAGHETTANAMTWTWYLLATHPEIQERMAEEVTRVLGDREAAPGDMAKLPYTRQVFSEGMRLYPPAHTFGRQNIDDYEMGPYMIPAATTFLISPYLVQRHPDYWEDAERFDPDRWTEEAIAARPRGAYIPFGGGPRTCIGENFAWLEGILVLATVAKRWRFAMEPGHVVEKLPLITLRPKYGLRLIAERRG